MLAQIAKIVLQFVQVIVLARLIAPAEFGILAMVVAFTGVAEILRDFGLSTAALRSSKLSHQQRTNLFWLNTLSGLILAIIIFLLSWPIAAFYGEPDVVFVVQCIAPVYLLAGVTAQFRVAIARDLRFRALAVCDVAPAILALGVAVPVAAAGHGLIALILLQVVQAVADLAFSCALAKWWPGLPRKTEGMRGLLSFGFSYAGAQLLAYAARNIDSIAIGRVWGAVELGFYDRAYRLSARPIIQIDRPMTKVALPVLSRVSDDSERLLRALNKAQLVACYLTTILLFVVAGLAEPIVEVLLGETWLAAAPLLAVLCISSVFRSVQQIAAWIQISKGNARALLIGNLIGQPFIIVTTLAGVPWGALGVAIGAACGYFGFWIFSMLWAGHTTGIPVRGLLLRAARVILLVGLPAGAAGYIASITIPLSGISLLACGLVASGIALFICWALSATTRAEIGELFRLVQSGLGRRSSK